MSKKDTLSKNESENIVKNLKKVPYQGTLKRM